jgi:hypothetical protein|tara:strand:+ start:63 stop:788 length:726 start_codon:yes stop_codon:yes gene_type:complete
MAQWQQEHEAKRRIEALVFEHRCELEDDGLDPDEIDRRCVEFRSQLNTTAAAPPAVVDEVSQPLPRLLEQLLSPDDRAAVEQAAVVCRRRYPRLNGEGDVTASPAHAITYLHRDGYFGRDHGVLLKKITDAMARDWRGPPLTVRCVEHHVYTEGGGLILEDHRDIGSSLSLSVLLSDGYAGGAFTTTNEAGVVSIHTPNVGDGVLFASETVHNVSTIESGERRALVVELWTGPATTHDRSK